MEVFVPLEHRGKRSYTQNRICHAAARNFRLGLVRVSGSLQIQPRCCSYAAVCRCGNGKCWLLRDKGLDSSPRWTQPRKAGTWLDWREKNEHTTLIVLVHELCKWKEEPFSQSLSHSHTVPFFCLLLLSLHCSLIINITALTPANEDEAGICIISPTWWTSPTPDLMRASLVCLLNLTCRRPHTVKRGEVPNRWHVHAVGFLIQECCLEMKRRRYRIAFDAALLEPRCQVNDNFREIGIILVEFLRVLNVVQFLGVLLTL